MTIYRVLAARAAHIVYTHDPASAVAVAFALVLVPVRMWTLYTGTGAGQYAVYPAWLQAWVAACLIGQLSAEIVGCLEMRRALTVFVILGALTSAIVQWAGDPHAGGWMLWTWVCAVELWVYYRLSIVAHVKAACNETG